MLGGFHHPFTQCWVWVDGQTKVQTFSPKFNGDGCFTDEIRSIWSYDGDTKNTIVCIVEYDLEESIC